MSYPQDDSRPSDTEMTANRIVTAFFDDREEAMRAIERLTVSGVSRNAINLVEGNSASDSENRMDNGIRETSASGAMQPREKGFFESLADFFLPEDDRHTYAEGLNRGGYVVTARVDDDHYDAALDILDDDGTVDIGTREQTWRSEGWSPSAMRAHQTDSHLDSTNTMATAEENMSVAGMTGAGLGLAGTPGSGMAGSRMPGADMTGSGTAGSDRTHGNRIASEAPGASSREPSLAGAGIGAADIGSDQRRAGGENVHSNTSEASRVGKRDMDHGRDRVRSYTLEEPVSEGATRLRERVEIEDDRDAARDTTGTRRG